jgi:hypothetical protein
MKPSFFIPACLVAVIAGCSTGSGGQGSDGSTVFEPGQPSPPEAGAKMDAGESSSGSSSGSSGSSGGSSGSSSGSSGSSSGSSGSSGGDMHPECVAYESTCGSPPGSPNYARDLCESLFSSCKTLGHSGTPAFITCGLAHQCSNVNCGHLKDNCTGPLP